MLKVNVPAELEGIAFIQVVIQKESEQLVSANIYQNGTFDPSLVEDVHWQKKLEQAQNVIFCKELFAQLAKEAIELQAPVPHMVIGNQISCSLSPDIQLLITLWYKSGKEGKKHAFETNTSKGAGKFIKEYQIERYRFRCSRFLARVRRTLCP